MARLIDRCAEAGDDAALCQLMRECPMGERVRVTLRREGGYFRGAAVQSERPFVYAAFDDRGKAMGVFSAGSRHVWVNGEPREVRYLSDLRIHPDVRGKRWLLKGYAKVRELLGEGFAQTLILSDNHEVNQLLTSGRTGLPHYHPAGEYLTLMFGHSNYGSNSSYSIRSAVDTDRPAMQKLYNDYASRRQFTPVLDLSEVGKSAYFDGLCLNDFCLVLRGGGLVAMAALWDQSSFKQLVVEHYTRGLRILRPVSIWFNGVNLPGQGQVFRTRALTAMAFVEDDPNALPDLVRYARSQLNAGENLMIGLDARDPNIPRLKKIRHWSQRGRHYLVGSPPADLIDDSRLFAFDIARV
jgi:hypothetical protein